MIGNYNGYKVEYETDGDSDNLVRYKVTVPNGDIVYRNLYEYELEKLLKKLTSRSGKKLTSNVVEE